MTSQTSIHPELVKGRPVDAGRIIDALVSHRAEVDNRYEAAVWWGTARSFIPGFNRDARIDANQATRLELLRKARYFECNSPLVNRLADLFEQYTVGSGGLPFIPSTSSEPWNAKASTSWASWGKLPDLTSRANLGTLQGLVAREWFVAGECFILKTRGESGRPRIQIIEPHRIGTPSARYADEGTTVVDGVEIDANGRPTAYYLLDGTPNGQRIAADDMIHVFEVPRPGMLRGLTFFYSCLNDLHDLDDLQLMEMMAAKDAAERSYAINTETGELPDSQARRREKFTIGTQKVDGTEITRARVQYFQKALGGRTVALKLNEKIEQLLPGRPTPATKELWNHLSTKVCDGVGIPYVLACPDSMQGTVYRGALDAANTFFRSRSAVLQDAFTRVYEYVIGWGKDYDPQLSGAPKDWFAVSTRPPRAVNVDVGRNSSAVLAELEAGTRTFESVYAELGLDWRTQLRQRTREAAFIAQEAAATGVDPSKVSSLMAAVAQAAVAQS